MINTTTKNVWLGSVKGKDVLAVLDLDGKIILKQIYMIGHISHLT
jgi:hypothetical protein